jgi:hypothetical protein
VKHRHTLFVALILGAAVAAGLFAATRTVDLGRAASTPHVSDRAVAERTAKLDRLEGSLQIALARRPPKLPRVPEVSASRGQASAPQPAGSGGVVYVRPPDHVVSASSSDDDSLESDSESEPESGDD